MPKVFGIGMFKTGTTSLGHALQKLGYRTLNGPWWPKEVMLADSWYQHPEEWDGYRGVIRTMTESFDAFQDYPWMFCFEMCHEWYPDAKFILTSRDSKSVAESDIRMWRRHGAADGQIPSPQAFIDRYENQYRRVVEFFSDKPGSLLIVNFEEGDGWNEICGFLNKPIPDEAFPHANKG